MLCARFIVRASMELRAGLALGVNCHFKCLQTETVFALNDVCVQKDLEAGE